MTRELKTAAEIQAEVSRLIYEMDLVREDDAQIRVPLPIGTFGDPSGCNWTMMTFGGDAGSYLQGIERCVREVQQRWNLMAQ